MGLIKAIAGAAGGVMADQWKEFFTCEALPADVLAVKGQKKTTRRSSNTHGDENIITTLERRMKCGIGKCGRCNIGSKYVCKDGPVFRFDQLDELPNEY